MARAVRHIIRTLIASLSVTTCIRTLAMQTTMIHPELLIRFHKFRYHVEVAARKIVISVRASSVNGVIC